jgi:hypothetical protein
LARVSGAGVDPRETAKLSGGPWVVPSAL